MAELVYTFIEKMNIGIVDEELNFSDGHKFKFDLTERYLSYDSVHKKSFFGTKVSNISLLVGKNGVGKSSILDLISLDVKYNTSRGRSSYFNIFHIMDNIFYIEGTSSLLKSISNLEMSKGLFVVGQENRFSPLNEKISQNLALSLIKSRTSVSWFSRMPYIVKNNSNLMIKKSVKQVESAENVFKFISESSSNRIVSNKIYLKIGQKQIYPTNGSQILDEIYGNEQITNPIEILPKSLLRRLKVNIDERTVSFNNRMVQNHYFGKYKKEFYIVQFLEKYLLSLVKLLEHLGESRNKISDILRYDSSPAIMNYDVRRLENTWEASKFLNKKLDVLKNMVNNLRDWSGRLEFFKGFSHKDTPFINRGDLDELIDGLQKFGEVGFEYSRGNSVRLEVSSKSLSENNIIDFSFVQLLMSEFKELFSVQFENLSDGEIIYYNTFSSIFAEIMRANERKTDCVLVLDEPDLNLHPEWCRLFINDCIGIVNKYSEVKVQFIVATHSPYMISDLLRDNVYTLQKNEKSRILISKPKKTFAANIIDILSDSFFLDYTVGEFAKNKLKKISQEEIGFIDDPVLKVLIEGSREER